MSEKNSVSTAVERARSDAERDHAETQSVVDDMKAKASTVLERLRKKAAAKKKHLTLVAKAK